MIEYFDLRPLVKDYINSLPATPERFKDISNTAVTSSAGEPAVVILWNNAVAMPTNSLIKYHAHLEQGVGQTMVFAEWQNEGSTTLTHSDMTATAVTPEAPDTRVGIAQECAQQQSRVRDKYDFLLKTPASAVGARCCSIVEVKRLERLSLHKPGCTLTDMDNPPDVVCIWRRNVVGITKQLQKNVDAVFAQVNAFASKHGIQYGMISNTLWSWAFKMDGKNNIQVSQPIRYDSTNPTVLQVHAWVTAMSLRHDLLPPWKTLNAHPFSEASVKTQNNLKSRKPEERQHATSTARNAGRSKPTKKTIQSIQKKQSPSVQLHVNASALGPSIASSLFPDLNAQQAASEFVIGDIRSVFAVGTSGPVFHARTSSGQDMALKISSLGSEKHHSLRHQAGCLMALRSLWGHCVPHVLLAGALQEHGHGFGLGTTLLHGRHPVPGDKALLPMAEEALKKIHEFGIVVNDLHAGNIIIGADGNITRIFFIDFSHASQPASVEACEAELRDLCEVFE